MTDTERNQLISRLLNQEGRSLSEVQKVLAAEHGITMTYLDLRLLAAELEVDWKKQDPVVPAADVDPDADDPAEAEAPTGDSQGTQITISKLVRPGAALSGDVVFASGAKAGWYVDQLGRLGLNPAPNSAKPTEEDLHEFQAELQRKLSGAGY